MSNVGQCRDTNELNKLVKVLLNKALQEIKAKGINPLIVETYRSQERQNFLYCLGRSITEVTVRGIASSFATKYCDSKASKVTWTLNSEHKTRKAVDIVPQRSVNGKMTAIWNAKDEETKQIISIMEKYGFEAGANWKTSPDSPHFQIKGNYVDIFTRNNTNSYITKMIQKALKITADGSWGDKTDQAVSAFRKKQGYKSSKPMLGVAALKKLLK